MSYFDYLKHNRARVILFVMSLSVILITLGIIQTLLFETITFLSEIADARGWFTFDWDFSGIFSGAGAASGVFMLAYLVEKATTKYVSTK